MRRHGMRSKLHANSITLIVEKEIVLAMWAARAHRDVRAGAKFIRSLDGTPLEVVGHTLQGPILKKISPRRFPI